MPKQSRQKILMCPPDYYTVNYAINAWMEEHVGKCDTDLAKRQWQYLYDRLSEHADIETMAPARHLPDLVFTANAGLVWNNKVVVSHFLAEQRKGETPLYEKWFRDNDYTILDWPEDIPFEGAGDALFSRAVTDRLWMGHGPRTDQETQQLLSEKFDIDVIPLHLIRPRFYHLDTCFTPLSGGYLMYVPTAFDAESLDAITHHVPKEKHIPLSEEDALSLACNAVEVNNHLFINNASPELQARLIERGFTPVLCPMSEFLKSGGSAKCLTLRLIEPQKAE